MLSDSNHYEVEFEVKKWKITFFLNKILTNP